jgi:hypothetical protein
MHLERYEKTYGFESHQHMMLIYIGAVCGATMPQSSIEAAVASKNKTDGVPFLKMGVNIEAIISEHIQKRAQAQNNVNRPDHVSSPIKANVTFMSNKVN